MIQMLIKNTLREVENYPYGIPNILREVGNIKNMIKKGRKSSQWVFGIHQYIKGCRKFKEKLIYHLFNNILRKVKNINIFISQI